MKITGTALSLNVADPAASADFAETHFGFTEAWRATASCRSSIRVRE